MEGEVIMLLNIHLGISIVTFVLYVLQNLSLQNRIEQKYGDKLKENQTRKKDISGAILSWLRLVVMSFTPIYNILLLIVIVFMSDKIVVKSDEMVEEALNEED